MSARRSAPHASRSALPAGVRPLLTFQVFNAMNFTVALGAPLVLTARYLGASESQVGLMTGLGPFMAILQVLTLGLIARIGCRRIMLWGWSTRSFALLLIAPLPLLVDRIGTGTAVASMLGAMVLFTVIRGLAAGAWLPWLKEILPEEQRGLFFGLEQRTINLSAFGTMVLCGLVLKGDPEPWRFSLLFVGAWLAGMISALMLSRTPPDTHAISDGESSRSVRSLVRAAKKALRHRAFRRSSLYVMLLTFAVSAVPMFLILFLNEEAGWSRGTVLVLQSVTAIGILTTAVFFGLLTDRAGSRGLLRLADVVIVLLVVYWMLCCFGILPVNYGGIGLSFLAWGITNCARTIAQGRLILLNSPQRDVTVSMAVFQVGFSLAAGLAPVVFGALLEALRPVLVMADGGAGPAFGAIFALMLVLTIASQWLLTNVPETKAVPAHQLLISGLYGFPLRLVSGLPITPARRSRRRRRNHESHRSHE